MSTTIERKSRSRPHAVNRDRACTRQRGRRRVRSIDCRLSRPIVRDSPDHRGPTLPRKRNEKGRHHMQFGVQFFPAVDHTDKSAADYYAESLAIAQEAETLGFTHARTVEHYFTRYGGYSPNPIVSLTAVSQRTKTMRLVTGAVLPVFNHPFKLAGEIAMLDGISGGGSTSDLRARFYRTNSAASASRPMNRRRASAKASNRSNSCSPRRMPLTAAASIPSRT